QRCLKDDGADRSGSTNPLQVTRALPGTLFQYNKRVSQCFVMVVAASDGSSGSLAANVDCVAFRHPNKEKTMFANRLARWVLRAPAAGLLAAVLFASIPSSAQDDKAGKGKQPDFIPAGYDDYQNMLDQLGIKKMRKGRDSKVKDTSDEATANPYKETMPDLMTFKDGTKVKTVDQWPKRRAEIVEDFEREVYGRIPKTVPKVKWEVTSTAEGESGGIATVTKMLGGHVDNSAFPQIKVTIQASFTVPKHAAGKVPIILQ